MEVGQGTNWGCSAKENKNYTKLNEENKLDYPCLNHILYRSSKRRYFISDYCAAEARNKNF
jgi:hypothetical protein